MRVCLTRNNIADAGASVGADVGADVGVSANVGVDAGDAARYDANDDVDGAQYNTDDANHSGTSLQGSDRRVEKSKMYLTMRTACAIPTTIVLVEAA